SPVYWSQIRSEISPRWSDVVYRTASPSSEIESSVQIPPHANKVSLQSEQATSQSHAGVESWGSALSAESEVSGQVGSAEIDTSTFCTRAVLWQGASAADVSRDIDGHAQRECG